jgi:hypothetical protein
MDVGAPCLCRSDDVERTPNRAHLVQRAEEEVKPERLPLAKK